MQHAAGCSACVVFYTHTVQMMVTQAQAHTALQFLSLSGNVDIGCGALLALHTFARFLPNVLLCTGIASLAAVGRMLGTDNSAVATESCTWFDRLFQREATERSSAASPQFHFLQSFGTFSLNFATVSPCIQHDDKPHQVLRWL
jgi:hypothetical protein